ncbi:MAG: RelA/SpoT family protein [Pseudomonadales bacterium]
MQTIESLADTLADYLESPQINAVRRAYYYAEQAHDGQLRRSGEPYVTHPLAVACILADMRMDHESLIAALLHDVIEDTGISKQALATQFTPAVADLVDGVSKLTQIEFRSKAEAQAENFQKMALAMAKDIRVILVKLADRLHNMRTLGVLRPDKRRRIAKETLEIYAPIANRLGMHNLRIDFEELGFATMHPMRARRFHSALKAVRGNRKELLENIRSAMLERLEQEGHQASVLGREKHLYGIYQKMKQKRKSFTDIMDVFAFRIIVDSVDTCYRVLGIIHSMYKPVAGQFKDYIAIPKANGYQSLHTVLFSSHGVPIEVQIRTLEMEEMANNGIAAHWLYKSGSNESSNSQQRARQWVQGLLEMQEVAGNSLEFIENVKIDLFPDEVHVFSPKGQIYTLPAGSTAVDFAYAVHTDVGNSCVSCRINRKLAPLSEPLQNGQTVEIITSTTSTPNPSWLNFVITGKARTTIRHFLKHQRESDAGDLGRQLLEQALRDLGSSLDGISEHQTEKFNQSTGVSLSKAMEEIGLGDRVALLSARKLLDLSDKSAPQGQPFAIAGTEGLTVDYAGCCHPLPGEHIIGHLSSGRGIVVHLENCNNVQRVRRDHEKTIPLVWAKEVEGVFSVAIRISLENRRGIFAQLANRVSAMDADIEQISTAEQDASFSTIDLVLSVTSRVHLANIMRRIRSIGGVQKVSRLKQ